jgi:hypothetical protein
VTLSKDHILASLATIETQAPLFYGDLPVPDDVVRDLFATAMAALRDSPDFQCATPQCREVSLLATLTHALLETALLREQLRLREEAANDEALRLIAQAATH